MPQFYCNKCGFLGRDTQDHDKLCNYTAYEYTEREAVEILQKEIFRLREALKKYGFCESGCQTTHLSDTGIIPSSDDCTCGFKELLESIK